MLGTGEVPQIVARLESRPLSRGQTHLGQTRCAQLAPGSVPLTLYRQRPRRTPAARRPRPELPTYLYDADTPRLLATPRHYAYVKIAEGCDYKCAFCIIPRLRGHYRSRPADSIVREAAGASPRAGVRELLLISQDTTFYGIDRGERGALGAPPPRAERGRRPRVDPPALPLPDDDRRRRCSTAMAECDKVCKYIDLPLQHASDAVLKRMRRPGTRAGYETLLDRIRRRVPGVTLRTTFIVGFPGRNRGRRRRAGRLRRGRPVRPRRRVHLLARGGHRGRRPRRRRARRR